MMDSSPEEAFRRLDQMATKHTDTLRKLTKLVQEARNDQDEEAVKDAVNDYDEQIEKFIPILMQQAKIYWDKGWARKIDIFCEFSPKFRASFELFFSKNLYFRKFCALLRFGRFSIFIFFDFLAFLNKKFTIFKCSTFLKILTKVNFD